MQNSNEIVFFLGQKYLFIVATWRLQNENKRSISSTIPESLVSLSKSVVLSPICSVFSPQFHIMVILVSLFDVLLKYLNHFYIYYNYLSNMILSHFVTQCKETLSLPNSRQKSDIYKLNVLSRLAFMY